jgi:hypothetical protein
MRSFRTLCLLVIFMVPISTGSPAFSANDIKLDGTVTLDAETCAKGASGPDCTLDFYVTGKAAKTIYDGMIAKGKMQECTGNVEKFDDSGMHCIKGKTVTDYGCDFSYGFAKHRFSAGPDGC